jgi:hypothetical protein
LALFVFALLLLLAIGFISGSVFIGKHSLDLPREQRGPHIGGRDRDSCGVLVSARNP